MLINRYKRSLKKKKQKNEPKQSSELETLTHEELEKVKNDDLKQRLDDLEIEYDASAIKKDLIDLLKGDAKEPTEEGQ